MENDATCSGFVFVVAPTLTTFDRHPGRLSALVAPLLPDEATVVTPWLRSVAIAGNIAVPIGLALHAATLVNVPTPRLRFMIASGGVKAVDASRSNARN